MKRILGIAAVLVSVLGVMAAVGALETTALQTGLDTPAVDEVAAVGGVRFEVRLAPDAAEAVAALGLEVPISGRLFVIISRDSTSEPRQQLGVMGVPLWGVDVENMSPGETVVLSTPDPSTGAGRGRSDVGAGAGGGVIGYPLGRFEQIPAGEYTVQAFLNVYTRFERADGHVVQMHLNSGAGQRAFRAPGNLYSKPRRLRIDPEHGGPLRLELGNVIAPIEPVPAGATLQQGNPSDRDNVRFVKIRSALLSTFWGRDMYIGANVLLPSDYDQYPEARYPAIYLQGHFPGRRAPFSYGSGGGRGDEFTRLWDSPQAPPLVIISIRDANPYYDTSYSVDSANVGPYGAAITTELIPFLEQRFRLIPEPWARVTAGGSTGGWEALAMQVFYPDLFGGAWGWCPDPVDFNYHQIVGIYEDDNAYTTGNEWHRVERPNARRPDGNIVSTVRQENTMERVRGPDSRSGGQWAIWQAVFGPVADDGYPAPIWDPVTGSIDHEVAEYWRARYDLHRILRRRWKQIGPSLRGKLHIAVGDMDTYYLEEAVYLLQDFLDSVQDPPAEASFEYGWREPHCWIGSSRVDADEELTNAEFVRGVAQYLAERTPARADWSSQR